MLFLMGSVPNKKWGVKFIGRSKVWTAVWIQSGLSRGSGEDDADDEAVEGDGFGEDHHEDYCDQDISVQVATHTRVAADADRHARGQARQTD